MEAIAEPFGLYTDGGRHLKEDMTVFEEEYTHTEIQDEFYSLLEGLNLEFRHHSFLNPFIHAGLDLLVSPGKRGAQFSRLNGQDVCAPKACELHRK